MTIEFAVMGHPNEGKSSVLSTLVEDDSVRVSDTPGETRVCRSFPVVIDGWEVLRFTDTPGFQNPERVLAELQQRLAKETPLQSLRRFAAKIEELHDDCELLQPVARGAGIIYVVDGSRPVRRVDRIEMEILRLTGKPRMAIINSKENKDRYLDDWKLEFRKNFNSSRVFNAHRATYAERILLLEALQSIEQDWQKDLSKVVDAVKKEWNARSETSAIIIATLLKDALSFQFTSKINNEGRMPETREELLQKYSRRLMTLEKEAHLQLRNLYRHNIFDYQLPPHSPLHSEIFDKQSWQLLGLTKAQLLLTGALGGATAGLSLDTATLGHSFGIFATLGCALGGLGALWGGDTLARRKSILGIPVPSFGGEQLQIGPAQDINLLFVLLNRSLLYYQHIINWAHGRRDYATEPPLEREKSGFTRQWSTARMNVCHDFFVSIKRKVPEARKEEILKDLIWEVLNEISKNTAK